MMTADEKDIIDLTADLSDLETTPKLSSAQKRPRSDSVSASVPVLKRAKRVRLIGEPFLTIGAEKHYRAVQYADMLIEVSDWNVVLAVADVRLIR